MQENSYKMPKEQVKAPIGAKKKIKDSVFSDLFRDKRYLLQLYQTLHPEDTDATEDSLTNITIENVLTDNLYNDLGFMVRDRLVILTEAQSKWSVNIVVRMFLYLAQTYREYFDSQKADLYSTKKVYMPIPELYVIYIGDRKDRPEYISLIEEYFNGAECALEIKVKVIYGDTDSDEQDIISQYVTFTKVYNEQVHLYGGTRKAVEETIRICKDRNVLRDYLANREKEVVDIMMTLFDEERIVEIYAENKAREAAIETARKAVELMLKEGELPLEKIAGYFPDLSIDDVKAIESEMKQPI